MQMISRASHISPSELNDLDHSVMSRPGSAATREPKQPVILRLEDFSDSVYEVVNLHHADYNCVWVLTEEHLEWRTLLPGVQHLEAI